MKIRLIVTMDVDEAGWVTEYSCDNNAKAIRDDVATYFDTYLNHLVGHLPINNMNVTRAGQRD